MPKQSQEKKDKAGGTTLPNFRQCYEATVIKREWHWHKNRHTGQWNKIKHPGISPQTNGQINLQKRRQDYTMGKTVSSASGIEKSEQLYVNQ